MKQPTYKYLFGPVPSRRFGRSLGIDLIPLKTCSLDCVFCQLGRTKQKTIKRERYVPTAEVLSEIADWVRNNGEADYLTLSGSGEPTLHSEFGDVLAFLRDQPIPSVLLTNGSLFTLPEVRKSASLARVVKISLSAWDQKSFEWINRPHRQIRFASHFEGIQRFCDTYDGLLWIEVFLLSGMNAMDEKVEKIALLANKLRPERIHLNTIARPPAEDFAAPVPVHQLEALTHLFNPPALIATEAETGRSKTIEANQATVLSMLKRRPCTNKQIQAAFGLHVNEVSKILGVLMRNDRIRADWKNKEVFYRLN